MWSMLLGLIPGAFSTINGITNAIANERLALISAKTDQDRIESQERINSLQAKRDLMIAESHSPWNGLMRFILALGPAAILLKFFAWDKVIGSLSGCAGEAGQHSISCVTFRTDPLDTNQWAVITAVIGFYFLYEGVRQFKR